MTRDLRICADFFKDKRIKALQRFAFGERCVLLFLILSGLAVKYSDGCSVRSKCGYLYTPDMLMIDYPDIKYLIMLGVPILEEKELISLINGRIYIKAVDLIKC